MGEHTPDHDRPSIDPDDAARTAYLRGWERFRDADAFHGDDDPEPSVAVGDYQTTATYINVVAPKLRKLCGYADPTGAGTYTGEREVDLPDGDTVAGHHILADVSDAWHRGAVDALAGNDKRPDTVTG